LTAGEIRRAVRIVLAAQDIAEAEISVAVVSDDEIHRVNREHLAHDFPTDVISFLYESDESPRRIEGEIVVSADTAAREAPRHGWEARSELLLYVVHGLLHLSGFDDLSPAVKRVMRREERRMMALLGVEKAARPGRG
jgi:probable rRNA maturation factor